MNLVRSTHNWDDGILECWNNGYGGKLRSHLQKTRALSKAENVGGWVRIHMRKEDEKVKWYLRPISVILLLFFVLGPFGLPLLYRSPQFSKTLKIILTVAVIFYTLYLIFALLEIGRELYKMMEELQGTLEQI
jgi:hypothetical protein